MNGSVLKYANLADQLREQIRQQRLAPGQQLPTEPDLAEQYQVGRVTVRKALQILASEGLLTRHKGRGTFVQPGTAANGTRRILYVGEMNSHFYKDFYINLHGQFQDSGDRFTGYGITNETDLEHNLNGLPELLSQATSVICHSAAWPVVRRHLPPTVEGVVVTGVYRAKDEDLEPAYYLSSNRYAATRLAANRLLDLGHTLVGFVGPDWDAHRERRAGSFVSLGQWGPNAEERQASSRHVLSRLKEWPTAFVIEADFRAVDFLRAAADLGRRCPDDFSVISVGNTPWSEATDPALTTVGLGEAEMAHLAGVLCRQPRPSEPMQFSVEPRLIDRQSTRALKPPTPSRKDHRT